MTEPLPLDGFYQKLKEIGALEAYTYYCEEHPTNPHLRQLPSLCFHFHRTLQSTDYWYAVTDLLRGTL
jgi:hypothetical protein